MGDHCAASAAGTAGSQSVKTTESGGVSGYDAGKKINGRKRHIVTDTLGGAAPGHPLPVSMVAPHLRRWRLCGRQITRCPQGSSPGSAAADASPKTGRKLSKAPAPGL